MRDGYLDSTINQKDKIMTKKADKEATPQEPKQPTMADVVADKIMQRHPEISELWVTSDGMAFYCQTDAKNHAATLKQKEVSHIKRVPCTN